MRAVSGYFDDVCRVDDIRLDGVRRDPEGARRLISSLARNVATPVTFESLTADANGADGSFLSKMIAGYPGALERLMVTEDLPVWKPPPRSRARLRAAKVRHLADPSIATAALNADPARVVRELEWMGFLLESLGVRDLRVYADLVDGRVFHCRDSNSLETDAMIELPGGPWAAFEIELGSDPRVVDAAARSRPLARAPG